MHIGKYKKILGIEIYRIIIGILTAILRIKYRFEF